MKKIAFVTGMTGQDGPYLAKHLLENDYKVYGLVKRYSNPNLANLNYLGIENDVELITGDITDDANMNHLIRTIRPNEFYNLAAQSFVGASWELNKQTTEVNAMGVLNVLNAIFNQNPTTKFYQASTSELYGNANVEGVQDEQTPFHPRSPYGVAKLYGFWIIKNYREAYNMHCSSGILFNHESPRRGETFVTRKITQGLSRISVGLQNVLYLGNLDAKRDWGHAKDYVEAMWMMLQQDEPDDYVIATGEQHSVREFVDAAAPIFGLNIEWMGEGLDEIGIDKVTKRTIVAVNEKYFRPAEVESLLGDATKAKEKLGWEPKTTFKQLVEDMCIYGQ